MSIVTKRTNNVLNLEDMRALARRKLPRAVFDAIDGAAGDEHTLRANREAFERIWLRPHALVDVSSRDLSTTVLGQPIALPVMIGPCGLARMAHSEAEFAIARAAAQIGTVFAVSGASSYSLEEIAETATGPLWYQLYMPGDQDQAEELVSRVERAGYPVLCVTIDSAVAPKRERDARNNFTIPFKITPKLVVTGMSRPLWTKDFLLGKVGKGSNIASYHAARTAIGNLATTITNLKSVTATEIKWLRERWPGKLVVKGILSGEAARALAALGVDGVVVSNHGGRNLDCVRATMDILPEVVSAGDSSMEVFLDGGIRRGTDVIKALALGARAVLIGRPYMYGLAGGGEAGVVHVLEMLRTELDRSMGLLGCAEVRDLDRSYVDVADVLRSRPD